MSVDGTTSLSSGLDFHTFRSRLNLVIWVFPVHNEVWVAVMV